MAPKIASIFDKAVEAPVVTSFTNIGYGLRRRIWDWSDLDSYDMAGKVVAITGPTSGIGLAASEQFAKLGATLILVARNADKVEALRDQLVTVVLQHASIIKFRMRSMLVSIELSEVSAFVGKRNFYGTVAAKIKQNNRVAIVHLANRFAVFLDYKGG